MTTKKARLRIKVPIDVATEIAADYVASPGPDVPVTVPGVKVVRIWNENYAGYDDPQPVGIIVSWGGRFFQNSEEYCYTSGGGVEDCDCEVFHYNKKGQEVVEFHEVFPEVVKRTIYR